jgi:YrhK-like protein
MLTSPDRSKPSGTHRLRTTEHGSGSSWTLERIQIVADIGSALLFVVGCVGFYSEQHQDNAITAFLVGSVLFLVSAVGAALAQRNGTSASPFVNIQPPKATTTAIEVE